MSQFVYPETGDSLETLYTNIIDTAVQCTTFVEVITKYIRGRF